MFTFGIGRGCDQNLVKECADAGGGTYSIISDKDPIKLKDKVVEAVRKASDPSL